MITAADIAAAWESGYWRGTSHTGPLNDAAVSATNPHKENDRDALAKEHATASGNTPTKEQIPMPKTIKIPRTVTDLVHLATELEMLPSEVMNLLKEMHGPRWWEHAGATQEIGAIK